MPFRFFRRIRVLPGLTLNLSKSGLNVSAGRPGAHMTVGPKGTTETLGIPGTGARWTEHQSSAGSNSRKEFLETKARGPSTSRLSNSRTASLDDVLDEVKIRKSEAQTWADRRTEDARKAKGPERQRHALEAAAHTGAVKAFAGLEDWLTAVRDTS